MHRPYPPEYRAQIIEFVRSGRSSESVAREPSVQTKRSGVRKSDPDEGRRSDGLRSTELAEIRKLRRKNRQLKIEREILKKAAAWFARESDSVPPKRTDS